MDTFNRHFTIEDDPPFPNNFKYDQNPEESFNGLLDFLYKVIGKSTGFKKCDPTIQVTPVQSSQIQETTTPSQSVQEEKQVVPAPVSSYKTRRSKRPKVVVTKDRTTEPEIRTLPPPPSWEHIVLQKLSLSSEELESFKVEQGFNRLPRESFFDFGTPQLALERMPRFSTSMPNRLCRESTALSLYKCLRNGRADGINFHQPAIEQAFSKPTYFNQVDMNDQQRGKSRDLQWQDTVITVDFYHPSPPASVVKKATPNYLKGLVLASTIEVLGSQSLKSLQARLFCENDFIHIKEIKHPRDSETLNWSHFAEIHDEETFQSASIVINNTAYVGDVHPNYGVILNKWENKKGQQSEPYKTESIKSTKLKNIEFKLGHPYLYIHSQNCEHIIVFKDVRYIHASDPQVSQAYPRFTYTGGFNSIPCRVSELHVARYVVKDCDRLPESLTPLCRHCCENFCYTSNEFGKEVPVGTFKLYPLIQVSSLLLNDCKISR